MKIEKKFRFQYYLDRLEGRKVLWMPRKEWEGIKPIFGKPVKIDVVQSPLEGLSKNASVLATVAVRSSAQIATIDIYAMMKRIILIQ